MHVIIFTLNIVEQILLIFSYLSLGNKVDLLIDFPSKLMMLQLLCVLFYLSKENKMHFTDKIVKTPFMPQASGWTYRC